MSKNSFFLNKKSFPFIIVSILSVLFFLSLVIIKSRAVGNTTTFKLQLQGSFPATPIASYKTKVNFYTKDGKVMEADNQNLTQLSNSFFQVQVNLENLDINQLYAVFIKPDKYTGRLFCSQTVSGSSCATPQFILKQGDNQIDLTGSTFLSGDLSPQQGKVSSYDLSLIIKDLGERSTTYMASDINSDQVVDTQDYSLALYALSQNAQDDAIPFKDNLPTPSLQPSETQPPTPTSTNEPSPTQTPNSEQSPTGAVAGGTCYGTLNGKAYVNAGLFGEQCRILNNETHHYCVTTQSGCNPDNCVQTIKNIVKQLLPSCSNGIATLDEQKTQVTCQTQFVSGNCNPEPTPTCDDNRPKC